MNVVFVLWYVIEYGKLCMNSLNDDNKVIWAKILMDCIALISGLFLGDALRRIWHSYKKQNTLAQNDKMMIVHLVMFVLYMATIIGKTISVSGYITSNYTKD